MFSRIIIFISFIFFLSTNQSFATEKSTLNIDSMFKNTDFIGCDKLMTQIDASGQCPDMMCLDILWASYASCWNKSMNRELNKRLLLLKNTNYKQFLFEMNLQKQFNAATHKMCGKNCENPGMHGIPYNSCRASAFKYRAAQAHQINNNQFTIPISTNMIPDKTKKEKEKEKESKKYLEFIQQLCKMPKDIWKNGTPSENCEKAALKEFDSFAFTDDVCDLS